MHYTIDGYNLLFRLFSAETGALQEKRCRLLRDLNEKAHLLNLKVSVIFDSQYFEGEGSRSHFGCLEILFTPQGITADEFILQKIKNSPTPRQETVVTSDRELAWHVRRQSAYTESVDEFLGWLNKKYKTKKKNEKEIAPPPFSISLKRKILPPQKAKTVPGDLDYYLEQFEKALEEAPPDPSSNQKKKELSEYERWLAIFEKRQENTED